jgi:hypothetical protein
MPRDGVHLASCLAANTGWVQWSNATKSTRSHSANWTLHPQVLAPFSESPPWWWTWPKWSHPEWVYAFYFLNIRVENKHFLACISQERDSSHFQSQTRNTKKRALNGFERRVTPCCGCLSKKLRHLINERTQTHTFKKTAARKKVPKPSSLYYGSFLLFAAAAYGGVIMKVCVVCVCIRKGKLIYMRCRCFGTSGN